MGISKILNIPIEHTFNPKIFTHCYIVLKNCDHFAYITNSQNCDERHKKKRKYGLKAPNGQHIVQAKPIDYTA